MIAPGDNIHSLRPLNCLLEKGCRVVFSSSSNPFPEGRERYNFIRFPDPRGGNPGHPDPGREGGKMFQKLLGDKGGDWLYRLFSLSTPPRLKVLWGRVSPTIIHVHWVDERAFYCVKAGLHPLVLTVWGTDINKHFLPNANPSWRRRVGEALAGADLILIDSADMHKKCAELAGREVMTELITQGVNTDRFRPGYTQAALEWRRRLCISVDATVLLSMRGWSPLYRHESILEAFARALPEINAEAILVFKTLKREGTDSEIHEKKIRDLAEKLGVAKWVRWMEEVPQNVLPEIYSIANVILNYPSMDGFPVTFLEAASCECPVISCRLPAYDGTFAEEYFHLVSPDDLSELSDAIVKFVNQNCTASRERLSELRQIVCRDYDEEIMAGRLLDIYYKLSVPSRQAPKLAGISKLLLK